MREPATFRLALGIALAVLCHGCSAGAVGVGGGAVNDRAIVLYSREVSSTDTARLVYAVVLRGRPGWHRPGVSYGFAESSWFGLWTKRTQTCTTGTVRIEIRYSSLSGTLAVAGRTIRLNEGNVVLVDSVDSGGERLPVRSAGRFDLPVAPGQALDRLLLEHNALARAFAAGS